MRNASIGLALVLMSALLGCSGAPTPKVSGPTGDKAQGHSDIGQKCLLTSDCRDGLHCELGSCAVQASPLGQDALNAVDKRAKGGKISGCRDAAECPQGMFCVSGYCSRVPGSK